MPSQFTTGDRVTLTKPSPYLRDYHGATPGTCGTVLGDFEGVTPDAEASTCMVQWDSDSDPVRCRFDEIMTVSRALQLAAHTAAKEKYGKGVVAVSRRVGFEAGVLWIKQHLSPEAAEAVLSKLVFAPQQ